MTRYLVDIDEELLTEQPSLDFPADWRIVEIGPGVGPHLRRCVVEDGSAPAELEGHLIDPTMQRGADGTVKVVSRTDRGFSVPINWKPGQVEHIRALLREAADGAVGAG
jgi:hypothetical protein